MTLDTDTPSVDWLKDQLARMRGWRQSTGDPQQAGAIARHEAWLAARLAELELHRKAA